MQFHQFLKLLCKDSVLSNLSLETLNRTSFQGDKMGTFEVLINQVPLTTNEIQDELLNMFAITF